MTEPESPPDSVGPALTVSALARRLGGNAWLTFWIVGLVTPVAIYALDFWEHALGLVETQGDSLNFLADRFAGKTTKGNC